MLNKFTGIGRISKDLEIKYMQNGEAVTDFNIALSEKYKDRDGNQQEKTEWLKVVIYGKRAETCSKYLGKGSLVYVEGKITTRKWQDKNGVDRYTTEVIAQNVVFLDSKKDNAPQGNGYNEPFPQEQGSSLDELPF